MLRILPPLLCLLVLCSSYYPIRKATPGQVEGYAPLYGPADDPALKLGAQPVRPTVNAGRIFVIGDKLFQVEAGSGVHIIDYTDRRNPVKKGFLNIPGCQEVTLKDSVLYANHFEDLVVLDVRNYPDVVETARIDNVLPEMNANYPPARGVYYECVDPRKGTVIGWVRKTINTGTCYR